MILRVRHMSLTNRNLTIHYWEDPLMPYICNPWEINKEAMNLWTWIPGKRLRNLGRKLNYRILMWLSNPLHAWLQVKPWRDLRSITERNLCITPLLLFQEWNTTKMITTQMTQTCQKSRPITKTQAATKMRIYRNKRTINASSKSKLMKYWLM